MGLLLIYRPQKDERLSWPSWLICSGRFTHIVVTHRLQAERRQGQFAGQRPIFCQLCYATRHVICDIAVCTVLLQQFSDSITLIFACIVMIIIPVVITVRGSIRSWDLTHTLCRCFVTLCKPAPYRNSRTYLLTYTRYRQACHQ